MIETIYALSLWQPWATLIAKGLKQYETRSWRRDSAIGNYVAIHASAKWDGKVKRYAYELGRRKPELEAELLVARNYGHVVKSLPHAAVLCVCRVMDIYPTEQVVSQLGVIERLCGDYTPGRFAWKVDVVEVFDVPIPAKGAQLLWKWDWEHAA